jgi:hypothetical protein
MITIKLKENEVELLLSILNENQEDRSNMGCNDPYPEEEALFSEQEIKEMGAYVNDGEDMGMPNFCYTEFIKRKIKEQTGL